MKKNLRKLLVLVLVFAMVLSVGAIGASAAFTDTASSNYKTAIDVMSGIGVLNGTTGGNYDPTGNLTREQAAKIITYMLLGPTNAAMISTASSQKFADVAPDRWSAGYIEYCANMGIIGGDGLGNFNPTGTLTTAAFTKMLLCAVGYKADVEGLTGTSWANNAASLALSAGISDTTIAISAATNCTREQAAQLAFKALQATLVQYTGGSVITVGGTTITTGATRSNVTTTSTTSYNGTNDGLIQFCEKYFPTLKVTTGSDDFGRPNAATWKLGATVVGTGLPALTKSYTTSVTVATLYADLGLSSSVTATTYTDGKANSGTQPITATDYSTYLGGNGTRTEVYLDTTGATPVVTIVYIHTYYGTVSSVTAATPTVPAYVTIAAGSVTLNTFASGTFTTTGLAAGTPIYYTVAATTSTTTYVVESVAAAQSVSATATSYTSTSLVAGGTTYSYSQEMSGSALADFAPHTLYLDSYGYVIYVAGTTSVANYAVVLAHGSGSDALGNAVPAVKLLFTDGTTKTVSTDIAYTTLDSQIVTYSVSASSGLYTLAAASTANGTGVNVAVSGGVSAMTLGTTTYYGNANTIYLVNNTSTTPDTYTLYTGIANVPSITDTASGATYAVYNDATGFARIVYIADIATTINGSSAATVYLTGTYQKVTDATLGTYYTSNAIVNGTPTTVKLVAAPTAGLYTGISYNSNNIGTIGNAASPVYTATGTKAAANGVIGLGSAYYTYSSDCTVYYISVATPNILPNGVGSVSSVNGIITDTNDTVTYTKNTAGLVNAIYIQIV